MNQIEIELLNIFDRLFNGETVQYDSLLIQTKNYLSQQYGFRVLEPTNSNSFTELEFVFGYDTNQLRDASPNAAVVSLFRLSSGQVRNQAQHIFERNVLSSTIILNKIGRLGYSLYDKLGDLKRKETSDKIIAKQAILQEANQKSQEKQTALLRNTFYIALITAIIALSQLWISFFDSQIDVNKISTIITVLIAILASYWMYYIFQHLEGAELKMKNATAISMIFLALLLAIVVFLSIHFHWLSPKNTPTKIAGEINVSNFNPKIILAVNNSQNNETLNTSLYTEMENSTNTNKSVNPTEDGVNLFTA